MKTNLQQHLDLQPHFIPLLTIAVTIDLPRARDILTAWPPDQRQAEIARCVDGLAAKVVALVAPDERKPRTKDEKEEFRQAWKDLVRGVALAAHKPGGVDLFGKHWCANHETCPTTPIPQQRTAQTLETAGELL